MPTVYVTVPQGHGESIARTLVEEHLAAGVNRVQCESTYRWKGDVVDAAEEILLAKTTAERYPVLRDRIRELHPHEVPCIERFDEADALGAFTEWREAATSTEN